MSDDLGDEDVGSVDSSPDISDTSSDVGSDVSEDIPVDLPEDVPDSGGDDLASDGSPDDQENVPEDVAEDTSVDATGDTPADVPEDVPNSAKDDLASDGSSADQEDIPEDVPEETSMDAPKDTPEEVQEDVSEEAEEQPPDQTEEKSSEQAAEQTVDQAEGQPSKQAEEMVMEKQQAGEYTGDSEVGPYDDIHNHHDNPGETDYFADSDRAGETLSPFKSENWEHIDDKKECIEELADYNADILGIDKKPSISYYCKENTNGSKEYGGFDPSTNVFSFNEYNLGDGPEAADTVSHEYRHAYQHQCSEAPVNERDHLFAENIIDYIQPWQSQSMYENQPIERDAREYAQRFKDYIIS